MNNETQERLGKMSDSRLKKGQERVRSSRRMRERAVTANRELTDTERREAFRRSNFQHRLPDIPIIDGYHVCWLSKTSQSAPIHSYLNMGYELIKAEEIPGFEYAQQVSGDYPGCIVVNEMVAAKIRLELYDDFMRIAHHEEPLAQASSIHRQMQGKAQEIAEGGKSRMSIGDGTKQLSVDPGAPDFTRMYGEAGEPYAPHELKYERMRNGELASDELEDARETAL
jgi:hypothetical protein